MFAAAASSHASVFQVFSVKKFKASVLFFHVAVCPVGVGDSHQLISAAVTPGPDPVLDNREVFLEQFRRSGSHFGQLRVNIEFFINFYPHEIY